jgi:gamma-glutamylputrescine oxidase
VAAGGGDPAAGPRGRRRDRRGVTGCAGAYALAEAGCRVRLYEAREIAGGASGRNGGFALRGGAPPYDEARVNLGATRARALWRLTERDLDRLAELAGDAFRRTGILWLAADADERAELETEYAALREDGFAVERLDDLPAPLAGRFDGAIFHPGDGSLRPARWVRRLATRAAAVGAELREGDRVESLDELEAEQGARHGTARAGPFLLPALRQARLRLPAADARPATRPGRLPRQGSGS